jgi:hypothetical protein
MAALSVVVFLLCLATCILCLVLLSLGYLRTRNRLLLWTAACFVFLAINSGLVVLDVLVFPEIDLRLYRQVATVAALSILLWGFIWEAD